MPTQTTCPSCHRPLRVPDSLIGKNVKCPGCQTTFVVEDPDSPSPPPLPPGPDAYRETQAPPARTEQEAYREEPGGRVPPPPPLPPPPEDDYDDEEREDERDDERRHERRRRKIIERSRSRVAVPAIGLIVVAGLSMAYALVDMAFRVIVGAGVFPGAGPGGRGGPPVVAVLIGGVGDLIGLIFAGLIIYGALEMKRLRNYGMAMTACILAILPCHGCCIVGLIFGIWGLVVLSDSDVKMTFKSAR